MAWEGEDFDLGGHGMAARPVFWGACKLIACFYPKSHRADNIMLSMSFETLEPLHAFPNPSNHPFSSARKPTSTLMGYLAGRSDTQAKAVSLLLESRGRPSI
jgi:hypothetical protein